MNTVPSNHRARKTRRRVVLVGLIALAGAVDMSPLAIADDVRSPAPAVASPQVSFRQLFARDAEKKQPKSVAAVAGGGAIPSTPAERGMLESNAASGPSLVSYLQVDAAKARPYGGSDEQDANKETSNGNEADEIQQPEGDRLGGESIFGGDVARSPSVENGRFELPPFMVASTRTGEIGNGRTPDGFGDDDSQVLQPLPESGLARGLDWDWTVRTWEAPNTFSNPRYFEDRMLERHGHERFPHLQPIVSGARFFATIPMLPYLAAVRHPCDCEYTLGYYRVGSCVPALRQRPPYERKAVIAEAASIATRVLILP